MFQKEHVEFLERTMAEGRIFARGKFPDGSGGLTIFEAESLEDARKLAESDPYVSEGGRRLDLHEWAMKLKTGALKASSLTFVTGDST